MKLSMVSSVISVHYLLLCITFTYLVKTLLMPYKQDRLRSTVTPIYITLQFK